jgi:hypothetical protein
MIISGGFEAFFWGGTIRHTKTHVIKGTAMEIRITEENKFFMAHSPTAS